MRSNLKVEVVYNDSMFTISYSCVRYPYGKVKYNFWLHNKRRRLRLFGFVECMLLYVFHFRIYTQDEVILRKR